MVISHCAMGRPSAGTDVQALRLELREAPALGQISPSGAVRGIIVSRKYLYDSWFFQNLCPIPRLVPLKRLIHRV